MCLKNQVARSADFNQYASVTGNNLMLAAPQSIHSIKPVFKSSVHMIKNHDFSEMAKTKLTLKNVCKATCAASDVLLKLP